MNWSNEQKYGGYLGEPEEEEEEEEEGGSSS